MFDGFEFRKPARSKELFWVSRRGSRIVLVALHVLAVLAIAIELLQPFSDDVQAVKRAGALEFPASYAIYGFTACVLLVVLGRILRRLVMRDEDYYRGGV